MGNERAVRGSKGVVVRATAPVADRNGVMWFAIDFGMVVHVVRLRDTTEIANLTRMVSDEQEEPGRIEDVLVEAITLSRNSFDEEFGDICVV